MQYADSNSHMRPGAWQATDCLVACESDDGAFVISSPNMAVIPEPRVGTADVHWEADGYFGYYDPVRWPQLDRKSTRLNSSHSGESRMPSSA